jgi:Na+/proline symporter
LVERPPPVGFKAAFAASAVAFVFVAIFALERVGAPDPLVAALGPLAALLGVAFLGVLTRAKTLLDFLVARRAVPPFYAGLALAAPIGGVALAFAGGEDDPSRLPWRGAVAGAAFAALVVAPRWRAAQASALADVLATRFPAVFVSAAFALILSACGWALAAAGLGYAALTVRGPLGLGPDAALAVSASALVLSLAPGGLRSLVWTDAASAAAGLAAIGLLVALSGGGFDRLASVESAARQWPSAPLVQELAAAAAAASPFAFASPAFAAPTPGAARRAGLAALAVLVCGGAGAAMVGDLDLKSPSGSALAALVGCLPALALARGGLFAASRAVGLDLWRAHKRLSVLASRRMARARGGVILGAAIAAVGARVSPHPSAPLYLGLALWLAFGAPSLVLATLPGRKPWPAIAALTASVAAAFFGRYTGFGNPTYGPALLVGALGAGMVGLAAGLIVFALTPQAASARLSDPFVELPGEG